MTISIVSKPREKRDFTIHERFPTFLHSVPHVVVLVLLSGVVDWLDKHLDAVFAWQTIGAFCILLLSPGVTAPRIVTGIITLT